MELLYGDLGGELPVSQQQGSKKGLGLLALGLVAQCSATPATVAATPKFGCLKRCRGATPPGTGGGEARHHDF